MPRTGLSTVDPLFRIGAYLKEAFVTASGLISYLQQIPWTTWLIVAGIAVAWLYSLWDRQVKASRERTAVDWPIVEASVHSVKVVERQSEKRRGGGYDAVLTYAFSYGQSSDEDYFTGVFIRSFNDEGVAGVWVGTFRDKRIPVRVRAGDPKHSLVLSSDLDQRFGPPGAEGLPGQVAQLLKGDSRDRLPARFRTPTEMAAWLAAICLVLSLIDHFYRVIVGHPLHPVLAPALWGVIALVGIPFWRWFGEKLNLSILNFPSQNANVPHWLRIYNWLIDFYVGLNWIVSAFKLDQFLHLQRHSNRLDPYSNGAFLLLLFGNAAASLFAALDRIEDPSNPATWSHISNE